MDIRSYFTNVVIDEFIFMPNHLHVIIEINRKEIEPSEQDGASSTNENPKVAAPAKWSGDEHNV